MSVGVYQSDVEEGLVESWKHRGTGADAEVVDEFFSEVKFWAHQWFSAVLLAEVFFVILLEGSIQVEEVFNVVNKNRGGVEVIFLDL